jgi:hypothetical protein
MLRTNSIVYSIYHTRGRHAGTDVSILVQTNVDGICAVKNFGSIDAFDVAQIAQAILGEDVHVERVSGAAFKQICHNAYVANFGIE